METENYLKILLDLGKIKSLIVEAKVRLEIAIDTKDWTEVTKVQNIILKLEKDI